MKIKFSGVSIMRLFSIFFKKYPLLSSVSFVYLILILLQINGSSMGILDPDNNLKIAGIDRSIRSDEFLRYSPSLISTFDSKDGTYSQLAAKPLAPNQNIEYLLLHPEEFLIRLLFNGSQLFSAYWWLGFYLLALGMTVFFDKENYDRRKVALVYLIIIFSPAVAWWSNQIVLILARTLLAAGFFMRSIGSNSKKKFLYLSLATWCLSGNATYYQPWALISFLFLFPYLLYKFVNQIKKTQLSLIKFSLCIFSGLIPFLFYVIKNLESLKIAKATVYPGKRLSQSGLDNFWNWAFSAPHQWILLNPTEVLSSNQSELSLGYLFILIPTLYYLFKNHDSKVTSHSKLIILVTFTSLLSWSAFRYPSSKINLLALVPPERSLTLVTTLTPLLFLIISQDSGKVSKSEKSTDYSKLSQRNLLFFLSALTAMLTYGSANSILDSISNFEFWMAIVSSVIVGYICLQLLEPRKIYRGLSMLAILAFISTAAVNPIAHTTNALTGNLLSSAIKSSETGIWASDDLYVDAVLTSVNAKILSGQQLSGPNSEKWKSIDPSSKFRSNWNNGASYVRFNWITTTNEIKISNPGPDQITIEISPCNDSLVKLGLKYVVSRKQLNGNCLVPLENFPQNYLQYPIFGYKII